MTGEQVTVAAARTSAARVRAAVAGVPDPELPIVTIADLGILRAVDLDEAAGYARVTITPTYSGCPALVAIAGVIDHAVRSRGWSCEVVTQLAPAWTTDWLSEAAVAKLRAAGIAPPTGSRPAGPIAVRLGRAPVDCPRCGSADTEEVARFGSTACMALHRCRACLEPFEHVKAH